VRLREGTCIATSAIATWGLVSWRNEAVSGDVSQNMAQPFVPSCSGIKGFKSSFPFLADRLNRG